MLALNIIIRNCYAFIGKSPQPAKITLWHRTGPSTSSTCDTDHLNGDLVQYNGDTAANMDFCGGCFVLTAESAARLYPASGLNDDVPCRSGLHRANRIFFDGASDAALALDLVLHAG